MASNVLERSEAGGDGGRSRRGNSRPDRHVKHWTNSTMNSASLAHSALAKDKLNSNNTGLSCRRLVDHFVFLIYGQCLAYLNVTSGWKVNLTSVLLIIMCLFGKKASVISTSLYINRLCLLSPCGMALCLASLGSRHPWGSSCWRKSRKTRACCENVCKCALFVSQTFISENIYL